jgi:uncharacterized membrane protein YbhN (UPF0104 family)
VSDGVDLRRAARSRFTPGMRRVVGLSALAATAHFLLPSIATAGGAAGALGQFHAVWLPAIVTAAAGTFAMAALSLMAASGAGLAFPRTIAAQLAAGFTNRLLPAGVGAMTTNVRYLERAGQTGADAVTAIGLDSVAGLVVHAVALVSVSAVFGASHQQLRVHSPDVPDNWPVLMLVALLLPATGVAMALARSDVRSAANRVGAHLTALGHDPRRTIRLLAASAGITTSFCLALCAAVQGAGGGISIVSIVAVFVVGSAVAAAAPTPGGLGALEAGLIAGLTSVGEPAAAAVTAVLVYRLVTFWLPVLPGAICFWALRRSGAL